MSNNINLETAIFASGCFWCTEAVFTKLKGVDKVVSGYIGGHIKNPAYREVCSGRTGHAEAVKVTYNHSLISFEELLEVFFATHNPTTLNKQGNDVGTQYRSAIFYTSEDQRRKSVEYISYLESNNVFNDKIVTEIKPASTFYQAEDDHQDYYLNNSEQPYCQIIISPKLNKLKTYFNSKLK